MEPSELLAPNELDALFYSIVNSGLMQQGPTELHPEAIVNSGLMQQVPTELHPEETSFIITSPLDDYIATKVCKQLDYCISLKALVRAVILKGIETGCVKYIWYKREQFLNLFANSIFKKKQNHIVFGNISVPEVDDAWDTIQNYDPLVPEDVNYYVKHLSDSSVIRTIVSTLIKNTVAHGQYVFFGSEECIDSLDVAKQKFIINAENIIYPTSKCDMIVRIQLCIDSQTDWFIPKEKPQDTEAKQILLLSECSYALQHLYEQCYDKVPFVSIYLNKLISFLYDLWEVKSSQELFAIQCRNVRIAFNETGIKIFHNGIDQHFDHRKQNSKEIIPVDVHMYLCMRSFVLLDRATPPNKIKKAIIYTPLFNVFSTVFRGVIVRCLNTHGVNDEINDCIVTEKTVIQRPVMVITGVKHVALRLAQDMSVRLGGQLVTFADMLVCMYKIHMFNKMPRYELLTLMKDSLLLITATGYCFYHPVLGILPMSNHEDVKPVADIKVNDGVYVLGCIYVLFNTLRTNNASPVVLVTEKMYDIRFACTLINVSDGYIEADVARAVSEFGNKAGLDVKYILSNRIHTHSTALTFADGFCVPKYEVNVYVINKEDVALKVAWYLDCDIITLNKVCGLLKAAREQPNTKWTLCVIDNVPALRCDTHTRFISDTGPFPLYTYKEALQVLSCGVYSTSKITILHVPIDSRNTTCNMSFIHLNSPSLESALTCMQRVKYTPFIITGFNAPVIAKWLSLILEIFSLDLCIVNDFSLKIDYAGLLCHMSEMRPHIVFDIVPPTLLFSSYIETLLSSRGNAGVVFYSSSANVELINICLSVTKEKKHIHVRQYGCIDDMVSDDGIFMPRNDTDANTIISILSHYNLIIPVLTAQEVISSVNTAYKSVNVPLKSQLNVLIKQINPVMHISNILRAVCAHLAPHGFVKWSESEMLVKLANMKRGNILYNPYRRFFILKYNHSEYIIHDYTLYHPSVNSLLPFINTYVQSQTWTPFNKCIVLEYPPNVDINNLVQILSTELNFYCIFGNLIDAAVNNYILNNNIGQIMNISTIEGAMYINGCAVYPLNRHTSAQDNTNVDVSFMKSVYKQCILSCKKGVILSCRYSNRCKDAVKPDITVHVYDTEPIIAWPNTHYISVNPDQMSITRCVEACSAATRDITIKATTTTKRPKP